MAFKKKQNNRHNQYEPFDAGVYRTGATEPQHSHRGIITILLIAVIVLCGAVSILGIMNIRMFRMLQSEATEYHPFRFSNTGPDAGNAVMLIPMETLEASAVLPGETASGIMEIPPVTGDAQTHWKDVSSVRPELGIIGELISPFYQSYYQLPQGFHITDVVPGSSADIAGLEPGDILISFDGTAVTSIDVLQALLDSCSRGDTVFAVVYRHGKLHNVTITIGEALG